MNQTIRRIMVALFLIPVVLAVLAIAYVMWPLVIVVAFIGLIAYIITTIKNRRVTV